MRTKVGAKLCTFFKPGSSQFIVLNTCRLAICTAFFRPHKSASAASGGIMQRGEGRKRGGLTTIYGERQSKKIERRWRRQRPLLPSLFLFLPRAFFLFLFMDPKGGGEEGKWGALFLRPFHSHAIPIPLRFFLFPRDLPHFPKLGRLFSVHRALARKNIPIFHMSLFPKPKQNTCWEK